MVYRVSSGGVHLLSGFAVGVLAPSPMTAFSAGVASHAVLDAIPHRDYEAWGTHAIDTAAALVLTLFLASRLPPGNRVRGFAGAIGGVLPDAEVVAFRAGVLPAGRKRFPSHTGTFPHGRGGLVWNVLLSAASVSGAGLVVWRARKRACGKPLHREIS
jgi:hypothetical protein